MCEQVSALYNLCALAANHESIAESDGISRLLRALSSHGAHSKALCDQVRGRTCLYPPPLPRQSLVVVGGRGLPAHTPPPYLERVGLWLGDEACG